MRTIPSASTALRRSGPLTALVVALHAAAAGTALAAPRVAVTVKPLHSLVAGVMAGVGEPDLIVRAAASPHSHSLKPSAARLLERAEVIFWVGESLETFMGKPLAALGRQALIVKATEVPGIRLVFGRAGGAWGGDEKDDRHIAPQEKSAPGGEPEHATPDGHIWLDPANARAIAREAADVLGRADPKNRDRYAANAAALLARIEALDAELEADLAPVRGVPYVVFHDAYQYFERRYGLRAVGSIAVNAERAPGARRVREIRETITSLGARCVFSEPQFSPAILGTLLAGTDCRAGTLDPLGAGVPEGPEAYFTMMRALGTSLAGCLGSP